MASRDLPGTAKARILGSMVIAVVLMTWSPSSLGQCRVTQLDQWFGDTPEQAAIFGASVAIDQGFAVVGRPWSDELGFSTGSAFVYQRVGTTWQLIQKLMASDAATLKEFGYSVAIDGEAIAIGSPSQLGGLGAAYVFVRSGSTWIEQARLVGSDSVAGDRFGVALALLGDRVAVGAERDDDLALDSGSVFIFERAGATWVETTKLSVGANAQENAGGSVTLGEESLLVGAPGRELMRGAAYFYSRSSGTWVLESRVESPRIQTPGDRFGFSVAVEGDTAVVGAINDNQFGTDSGAAFVFVRNGSTWDLSQQLTAWNQDEYWLFGASCAIEGKNLVIGSRATLDIGRGTGHGAAFLFRDGTGGWTQTEEIVGLDTAAADFFGNDVDLDGSTLLVGAKDQDLFLSDAGCAYVFDIAPTNRLYVDQTATGSNAGNCWLNAFVDLSTALSAATVGDEVWVADGAYKPTTGADRASSFQLKNGVAIYGGFAGDETQLTQRDPALHPTILSGDLLGNDAPNFVNYGDNSHHVVVASNVNLTAVLDGFVIRGGAADGPLAEDNCGGGLFIKSASPQIAGCTIEANLAQYPAVGRGGGVYLDIGSPIFIGCTIRQNRAWSAGGLHLGGAPCLDQCVIEGNTSAFDGGGIYGMGRLRIEACSMTQNVSESGRGGGIAIGYLTTAKIVDTGFVGNRSKHEGGALNSSGGYPGPSVLRCHFEGNTCLGGGGAVRFIGRKLTLDRSMFLNNSCLGAGGGLLLTTGGTGSIVSRVASCQFIGNSAREGGGMHLDLYVSVANCLVYGNRATQGGGVYVFNTTSFFPDRPFLINCTIVGNTAVASGGGLMRGGGFVVVGNSILWANHAHSGSQIGAPGGVAISYSQVQGGYPGLNNSSLDPQFVSLATGDLHVLSGSPCNDSGTNGPSAFFGPTDLDQNLRRHDDPSTPDTGLGTAPIVDRGAYEFGSPPACAADCDGDGTCDDVEISSGEDTDMNGNAIPDGCDGKVVTSVDQGDSVTLLPDGGSGDPTLEPVVELTNVSGPNGATVTVVQSDTDVHPGAGGYGTLGKTVTIETSLADGELWMRVKIPFSAADLAGMAWSSIDLLYFDTGTHNWELAPRRNTVDSPGHAGPIGDRFADAGTMIPPLSTDLGDYGVFWNTTTYTGFAWANVDHTTDFSGGVVFGTVKDCNENGIDDLVEIEAGAADCNFNGILDDCELALRQAPDCNGNGVLDSCELEAGTQPDCNLNGVPDSCDLASGTSHDRYPLGGDGIPDECQIRVKTSK